LSAPIETNCVIRDMYCDVHSVGRFFAAVAMRRNYWCNQRFLCGPFRYWRHSNNSGILKEVFSLWSDPRLYTEVHRACKGDYSRRIIIRQDYSTESIIEYRDHGDWNYWEWRPWEFVHWSLSLRRRIEELMATEARRLL
jgi:hypothetical protein